MHTCEFCSIQFEARPQVKIPRACKDCQVLRQRANERDWHERNLHLHSHTYHKSKREVRLTKLRKLASVFTECLRVGQDFFGIKFLNDFELFFAQAFIRLGVRQINKFCDLEKINAHASMATLE
jgi:hypothetical protein